MDFDVLILALVILMAVTVGAYIAKNELSPRPEPKVVKEYYHINF